MTDVLPIHQLEQYTLRFPEEVLVVNARLAGEEEYVIVFRGFSSSLTRSTDPDPEIPVLPAEAVIETIDRLQGPYVPDNPQYLEQAIAWPTFRDRLVKMSP
ncbi:MAG: hypothetical protein AAGE59_36760 [Cyanobacteria bacterium P01_F01_bin.86]